MKSYVYVWEDKNGDTVSGVITHLNQRQFVKDELAMCLEMMKAGWSLIEKGEWKKAES